jgi:Tfp pilus assembly protein PilF
VRATRQRVDRRRLGTLLTLLAVLVGGALLQGTRPIHPTAPVSSAQDELRGRFEQAVALLQGRRYEQAASAWHAVLKLAPRLPEAHVNMGYTMLGLHRPQAARDFFEGAIALKADQANAYHGLAVAYEAGGDPELAIGAMRSYLHLARQESEAHLRLARAALWEWEAALQARRAGSTPPR